MAKKVKGEDTSKEQEMATHRRNETDRTWGDGLTEDEKADIQAHVEQVNEELGGAYVRLTIPRMLRPVSRIASADPERPALCGVHVRCADGVLEVAACDGRIAILAVAKADESVELPDGVTIKTEDFKAGLAHVAKKAEERNAHPTVELVVMPKAAEIVNRGADTTIRVDSRQVQGQFPSMGVAIPEYEMDRKAAKPSGPQIAAYAMINPTLLAKLLSTIAAMTNGKVRLEVPLGFEGGIVCRAELEDGIGTVTGVVMPLREKEVGD